jgi:phosphoglycerate-specific signal transduction histidine kinase
MSLFSKFRNSQSGTEPPGSLKPLAPEQAEEAPLTWAMSKEEYDALMRKLANIVENVIIVNDNVRLAIEKINTLQSDMGVSINTELILGRDQDKLIDSVRGIGHTVNRVERLLENLSK